MSLAHDGRLWNGIGASTPYHKQPLPFSDGVEGYNLWDFATRDLRDRLWASATATEQAMATEPAMATDQDTGTEVTGARLAWWWSAAEDL